MQEQTSQRQGPPWWADLLIMAAAVTGNLVLVWSQLPSQERENLTLACRMRLRSMGRGVAVRAWRAGRAGMAEELAGRDPSAHYVAAAWLGRWRDRMERA